MKFLIFKQISYFIAFSIKRVENFVWISDAEYLIYRSLIIGNEIVLKLLSLYFSVLHNFYVLASLYERDA